VSIQRRKINFKIFYINILRSIKNSIQKLFFQKLITSTDTLYSLLFSNRSLVVVSRHKVTLQKYFSHMILLILYNL